MLEVPFTLNSQPVVNNISQLVSFSVPFKKSSLFSFKNLTIQVDNKKNCNVEPHLLDDLHINTDFTILSLWPDGSIKWLLCEYISYENIDNYHLIEQKTPIKTNITQIESCNEQENIINITCSEHTFSLNKATLGFQCLPWSIELISENNDRLLPKITNVTQINRQKKLTTTLLFNGQFTQQANNVTLSFDATLSFCHQLNTVKVDFTLRNENPMISAGGKWDLGNENSILFNACNVVFNNNKSEIQLDTQKTWQSLHNTHTLFQASSGGENWQSDNHINANRENKLPFKGYQFSEQTHEQKVLMQGLRAVPSVKINANDDKLNQSEKNKEYYIHLTNFWQNFPKSIECKNEQVVLGLFPSQHVQAHELQPGEQKTHTFFIALNEQSLQRVQSSVLVNISPEYLASTHTLPFFANNTASNNDGIDHLIELGLSHKNNFFEKREQIDEFGWRNFGDIYADHETLEYQSDNAEQHANNQALISHYNNQYDPLYGFLRQYLLTKNEKWWQLANDLALHVKDIDIYHTQQDKAEYNQGLFWHTDHYLPAETATHRTYSKYQKAGAYQDHAGGGGPGGQHCYTTGLALHYLLTGDETSKSTVLNLAQWITYVYEGNGAFFDTLLKVKNSDYPGVKNIITGQYPLDRGTGNYIVALIDAYQVSDKQSYLDQASLIIKNTASPSEDLTDRHLNNIEECWFYTVFLQAVTRYLQVKEQLSQFDESFSYANALLLHFANWMSKHEQPYLTVPEALEYPNHTWAAQDIRKANVLYLSAYYAKNYTKVSAETVTQYQQKADNIYQYVEHTLSHEKTHYFTRILSILMQNHGIKNYVNMYPTSSNAIDDAVKEQQLKTAYPVALPTQKAWQLLCCSLINTSVKMELTWLRQRVKKIDNLLLKLGSKP